MTPINIDRIVALAEKATPGPYRSMRDGNQYLETRYIPTCKLVGASRIDGLKRPWNPHAAIAFGLKAEDHEIVRFTDEDADYIAACSPETILALCNAVRCAMEYKKLHDLHFEDCSICKNLYEALMPFGRE